MSCPKRGTVRMEKRVTGPMQPTQGFFGLIAEQYDTSLISLEAFLKERVAATQAEPSQSPVLMMIPHLPHSHRIFF